MSDKPPSYALYEFDPESDSWVLRRTDVSPWGLRRAMREACGPDGDRAAFLAVPEPVPEGFAPGPPAPKADAGEVP